MPDKNRAGAQALAALARSPLTALLYSEPLAKAGVMAELADAADCGVTYLDFDLMYSGHVASGMIERSDNVEIVAPLGGDMRAAFARAISRASAERRIVVVDSLNGVFRAYRGRGGVAVDATLMMLASLSAAAGSRVLLACMARLDPDDGWMLSPMGRRVPDIGGMGRLYASAPGGRPRVEALRDGMTPPAAWRA